LPLHEKVAEAADERGAARGTADAPSADAARERARVHRQVEETGDAVA
jgi:hypothetical protein